MGRWKLAEQPRRVALITNAALAEAGDELSSPLSSVRREIVLTARALEARGVAVHVLSLPAWPREQVRAIVEKADRIVFGAMLDQDDERAYREVVALCGKERRLIFFIGERDAQQHPFYRGVSALSQAWLVRSVAIKKSLEHEHPFKIEVDPMPLESARGTPHVPRRGWRARAGTAIARRYGIGLDPWRLKLLWIGNAAESQSLLDALGELREIAAQVPLKLQCLTAAEKIESHSTAPQTAGSAALRIGVERSSSDAVAAALADCDAVILPNAELFIDALHAGRFVIARPHSEYESLGEFAWIGTSIGKGVRWLLRDPQEAMQRLLAGQGYVAQNHSLAAIGRFWMRLLEFGRAEDPGPLVRRARGEYHAGNLAEAERLLGNALQLDGALPEAQHLLGNVHQDQGRLDRAISCYRRALRLDAAFAAAHNDLGTAYVAKGWPEEAVECYLQAVRFDSANDVAHANLAQTLLKLGRRREALRHFKAALGSRLRYFLRRRLKINKRRSIP